MSEVTRILSAIEHGDPRVAAELLPLVYDELRTLAAQKLDRARRCRRRPWSTRPTSAW
jgi:ECF sigma factor